MFKKIKRLISRTITCPIVGRVISLLYKQVSYFGIKVTLANSTMSDTNKAAVFWNLYESAEARLINGYIRADLPVIELGSSLGVISRLIATRLTAPLVCIEANKDLLPSIELNLRDIPKLSYRIMNNALSYSNEPVLFAARNGENLTGRVNATSGVSVNSITLKEILQTMGISDFVLVMDIEGSEIEIFINDRISLNNCKMMIMELHDIDYKGQYYSIDAMISLVEASGFTLLKRDGNCFAYIRANAI